MPTTPLSRLLDVSKVLANRARLRILAALEGRELCVGQVAAIFDVARPTASEHLSSLRRSGLVAERRNGKVAYCSLVVDEHARKVLDVVLSELTTDAAVLKDRELAAQVLALPHDLVCEMGCASCHDVHGENGDAAKGPEATCLSCHAEAAGPWVFPHRAMEDGCSSCHVPHGSVNRSLLKTSGNGVCLTCHVQTNFPAAGKIPHNRTLQGGGKCLDCHSEVHGSNVDELMAPQYRKR